MNPAWGGSCPTSGHAKNGTEKRQIYEFLMESFTTDVPTLSVERVRELLGEKGVIPVNSTWSDQQVVQAMGTFGFGVVHTYDDE